MVPAMFGARLTLWLCGWTFGEAWTLVALVNLSGERERRL